MPMYWRTLIRVDELARRLHDCVVVDCRHDLTDPQYGPAAWADAHLPGAFFLHQDHDLAGARTGTNGRHPLPERETLRRKLESIGLADGRQLVACDENGGMFAARLWWLSRWLGHPEVAVLDGGLPAWVAAGHALTREPPTPRPRGTLTLRAARTVQVDVAPLHAQLGTGQLRIVDARAPERWRGEVEPLDPVAGRIPGAVNRPHTENLQPDGRFKSPQALRAEFTTLLDGRDAGSLVHHCGSGVAACHNLLAMEIAGLPGAALYPGSWSEWCADPVRPVAVGAAD